jgi:hypothetical protein
LITHDPQKITEELRNHLASHDRSFCFLFGAGASSAINVAPIPKAGAKRQYIPLIPSIVPLTQICKEAASSLGENFSKALELLENQCETSKKDVNIENVGEFGDLLIEAKTIKNRYASASETRFPRHIASCARQRDRKTGDRN